MTRSPDHGDHPISPSFVSFVVLGFPITRCPDHQITRSFAPLCLRPSATDPTPHRALLKTKAKVQFERPVKRLSTPFFHVFQGFNLGPISASFSRFRCWVGRGSQVLAFARSQQLVAFFFQRPSSRA